MAEYSSFYEACKSGNINLVKFTLSLSNSKDQDLWNHGFCGACSGGHVSIVKFVFYKANNWLQGLYIACTNGHKPVESI